MRFFKLIKRIIVMICILSNINSYAQIAVSDGSAFITKNEFAGELNSISNRMDRLKSSIDAKIDSIVSSYLSRNGIWEASEQVMLNKTLPAYTSPGELTYRTVYDLDLFQRKIVQKISKNGLAVVIVDWSTSANYPRIGARGSTTHTRTDNASAREFNIYFSEQDEKDTVMKRTKDCLRAKLPIGSSVYNVSSEGLISEIVLPKKGILTSMFFVTKGKSLWACENFYYYEFFVTLKLTASSMPTFNLKVNVY